MERLSDAARAGRRFSLIILETRSQVGLLHRRGRRQKTQPTEEPPQNEKCHGIPSFRGSPKTQPHDACYPLWEKPPGKPKDPRSLQGVYTPSYGHGKHLGRQLSPPPWEPANANAPPSPPALRWPRMPATRPPPSGGSLKMRCGSVQLGAGRAPGGRPWPQNVAPRCSSVQAGAEGGCNLGGSCLLSRQR